jgi:flagellar motor switch protein FliG
LSKKKSDIPKGAAMAIEMLQKLDGASREKLLEQMTQKDPRLSDFLKNNLVQFEDLINLTQRMLLVLLKHISIQQLSKSLRGSSKGLISHIRANVSKNMRQEIDDVLSGSPLRLQDIEDARQEIMEVVLEKVTSGEIVLFQDKNDPYV